MRQLRSILIAAVLGLFGAAASAQAPPNMTNFWIGPAAFSLDPKDPDPIRSMFQVVELDRVVTSDDIRVFTESLTNARTVQARWFQRLSNRGTNIVFIEVQAVPKHLGKPALAAYQILCGGYFAMSIETIEDIRQRRHAKSSYFVEPLCHDNGFMVVYPEFGTVMASINVVNPLVETEWIANVPVTADATFWFNCDNKADFFRLKNQAGLVTVTSLLANVFDDHAALGLVSYLNMDVHPDEWHKIKVEPKVPLTQ